MPGTASNKKKMLYWTTTFMLFADMGNGKPRVPG